MAVSLGLFIGFTRPIRFLRWCDRLGDASCAESWAELTHGSLELERRGSLAMFPARPPDELTGEVDVGGMPTFVAIDEMAFVVAVYRPWPRPTRWTWAVKDGRVLRVGSSRHGPAIFDEDRGMVLVPRAGPRGTASPRH